MQPQPQLQSQGIAQHQVTANVGCGSQLLLQRIALSEQRGSQGSACPSGTGSCAWELCFQQAPPGLAKATWSGSGSALCQQVDVLTPTPEVDCTS